MDIYEDEEAELLLSYNRKYYDSYYPVHLSRILLINLSL